MTPFKIVFLISSSSWYFLYQRPHHFARQFVRRGHRVVSVGFESVRGFLRRVASSGDFVEHRKSANRIYSFPVVPLRRLPIVSSVSRLTAAACISALEVLEGIDDTTVLWVQGVGDIVPAERIARLPRRLLVWDICDDYAALRPEIANSIRTEERIMASHADVILVSTPSLFERWAQVSKAYLVRNGVDAIAFASPGERPRDLPPMGPVAGYHGYIGSWFDFGLMREVIRSLRQVHFVFIGPLDPAAAVHFQQLAAEPNVYYLGSKPYHILPKYVGWFDIGLVPFVRGQITESANPIKMYEYLAAGKPVIGTALPELNFYREDGIVETASRAEDFAAAVLSLAVKGSDPALQARRKALASQNTWEKRFEDVWEILRSHNGRQQG